MAKHKHLTLEDRFTISNLLDGNYSFKGIGTELEKDCTTISKEIRSHIVFKKTGSYGHPFNACMHRFSCDVRMLCSPCSSGRNYHFCRFCKSCNKNCSNFRQEFCERHNKPPYVCNGCEKLRSCTLEKHFYHASDAYAEYREVLSESRSGISLSEDEVRHLDELVSPLIMRGQSLNHICANNRDSFMVSESTLYRLVDYNLFSARNIDLPRKVRYKQRKHKKIFKVDKSCRIGRTFEDFQKFMKEHPQLPVTEMDSVEGKKGGKVLLTIHFVKSELMLAFIRNSNDSQSVIDVIDRLYPELRPDVFMALMPVLVGDNGSEFSNPSALEFDSQKNRRTYVFYCDPSSPYQKGSAERNHEFIRLFIPKGKSMDAFLQEDITLMMNHINSYSREILGNKCPYEVFSFLHGENVLKQLDCIRIPANEVTLNPSIFPKKKEGLGNG
ncbi:MAG TPA: IS30 family transposase [Anaerovoracaceae bacterium]|nr:IS30 family transposase [Anaerovoracaceae bacterium]